jgi:PHD/YefM family antitoxin component YafN of YafNO toxin-antitoxin module
METNEIKTPVSLNVQYVVGGNGEPTAVVVDIDTWNHMMRRLKEVEELSSIAQDTHRTDPDSWDLEKVGYRTWQSIREELREQLLRDEQNALHSADRAPDDYVPPRCC